MLGTDEDRENYPPASRGLLSRASGSALGSRNHVAKCSSRSRVFVNAEWPMGSTRLIHGLHKRLVL
jgi:hypothetical protein